MTIITIVRIVKLGFQNFWRNRWLSLAATLMIMLTLLTMGIFAVLTVFVNSTTQGIRDRIDLSIYFYDAASEEQIKEIQYQLSSQPDVTRVTYINKSDALAIWQQRTIDSKVKNLITLDDNPLPRSLEIKTTAPENLVAIAQRYSADQYKETVREISYQKTKATIDRIVRLTSFIQRLGLVLTSFLLVISLIVILNTIRLTVFTRRDEIEIMRLVGANSAFIRIPFSVEAILYGIFGGLLAYSLIVGLMTYFGPRLAGYFADVASAGATSYFNLIQPYFLAVATGHPVSFIGSFINLWQLGLLQLTVGIIFSIFCSLVALRRYLRV